MSDIVAVIAVVLSSIGVGISLTCVIAVEMGRRR